MQRLLLFLYRYRAFLIFLALEVFSGWLIIENNSYQGAAYFNSSNRLAANLMQTTNSIRDYFDLKEVNDKLVLENAELKSELRQLNQSIFNPEISIISDFEILNKYEYQRAKVINNSIRRFNNYITIDRGSAHGIAPDMAVIGNDGVVGKVKATSENFSVITSILHSDVLISSRIKNTGDLCTTKWGGKDPYVADLLYVPLHVEVSEGDTVVTSGFNAVFPEDIPIGIIKSVKSEEDDLFYDIDIELSSDLNNLAYVYIIKNMLKVEQDSIENITTEIK